MSSIIINSFYRALTSIDEYEGIKNLTVKQLTTLLVDQLYPEDGVLTWEDEKTLKIKFNGKVPVEEETHSVEVTIPVAEPAAPEPAPAEPEVKEIKVKEVKPKLTKEQKAAEKAEKEAKAAEAKAAKEQKATEAKAAKEAKAAAKPKGPKAKESAEPPAPAPVEPAPAEPKVAKPKAAKAKFVGNLEKLNPTQDKLWKKVAAESKVELTDDHKKRFLAHINELDNTEYNTKKLETWMSEFFAPKEETKTKDVEMFVVEYKGKEYLVDEDENVYEATSGDGLVEKKLGKVGLAYFKDMQMPE
jgi:colicin import membrane protein